MPPWSSLQYFWPALSGNCIENQFLVYTYFLSGRLRPNLCYGRSSQIEVTLSLLCPNTSARNWQMACLYQRRMSKWLWYISDKEFITTKECCRTGGLNWLPHKCATIWDAFIHISDLFLLFFLVFPKLKLLFVTPSFSKIKLLLVTPSFAQYVNWNKHPVPVHPSSRLINMNNSNRA